MRKKEMIKRWIYGIVGSLVLCVGTVSAQRTLSLEECREMALENNAKMKNTLRFDVDHKVRLIDIKEYAYGGYPFLRGFISGLHAGNFDITHIFIDNLYKLSQDSDPKETENFLDWCSVFSAENSVAFTLTIAGEAKDAPEYIARYMD